MAMDVSSTEYKGLFPGRPDQISKVRAEVGGYLTGCPVRDDVVLIVSELATNAILYTASSEGSFTVRVTRNSVWVFLEVIDAGGLWPWIPAPAEDGRAHGLSIVDALATNWGVSPADPGCSVWAVIHT
jgi:anti-sigma regulatory factor (Ser/Thr protein kinase)